MLDFVKYPHDRTMKNIAIDCTFPSLPETNVAPENDGWSTTFLLGWPIFRGELLVSGRVAIGRKFPR